MTIKIKRLSIEKDGAKEVLRGGLGTSVSSYKKLSGAITVELSEGIVTGQSEVDVESISEELQNELHKVLNKIEDELNGVGTDEDDSPKVETINITLNVNNMSGDAKDIEGFSKKIADSLKRSQGIR